MAAFDFCEKMILMVSMLRALQAACPPDWLTWQDSCYILLPKKMNWTDAKKACDRHSVSLVFPNSLEEQSYLWEEMSTRMRELGANSSDDLQLWINCYRYDDESFICSGYEGTSYFRNWGVAEPSNQPNEVCVRMADTFEGKWGDRLCHVYYFVACEMSALSYGCRQSSPRYIHVPQQCLLNHQIKSYPVKESIGCGLACWAEPLCRSFNLWKQADNKTSCQLNHASRMDADVTDIKYEENCYLYEP
ncbi:snaclec bothrojaracin subunit beta-like [Asterias amurensis]|uniref:snaclec bothrojaracin subunit beta-like n=1 Tax=Asterias amurensis TaxID=7602 RepID=UPI003AB7D4FF